MKPIIKTFKNGLRAVICPQNGAQAVTALILVSAGSKYESDREHGISHFLEHMYFKGTIKHPSAKIISEKLEGLGAINNAFTTQEYTGYYVKGNPKHLNTFLGVLSDIYINSTFPEAEIQKEKGVIIEEINMYEDLPRSIVGDELMALLYQDQPAGKTILGTKEGVTSFKQKDFLNYRKKFYTASNTVVVISGNVNSFSSLKQIEKLFKDLPKGTKNKKQKVVDTQSKALLKIRNKKTDQAHIAMAFRSLPFGHKDSYIVSMLATILGGGMSSRLFSKLRDDLGAAYYVYADKDSLTDHGIFGIYAGIDKNRLQIIIESIVNELVKIKEELISKEELIKVKEYSIGMMGLGLESSDSIANFYGHPLVIGSKIRTPNEIKKKIMNVTTKQIKDMANKLFNKNNVSFVLVGPFKNGAVSSKIFDALD